MSNGTAAPQGLQPVRHIDGTPWNGGFGNYLIASAYATSLFIGDPVTMLNDGTIGIGTAGNPILGVFGGWKGTTTAGSVYPGGLGGFAAGYWPAATAILGGAPAVALVIDDPTVIFHIESSSSAGMTQTGLNLNYNFISGTGSTASGQSAYALNQATGAATNTLNLKALRLAPYAANNGFGVGYNVIEVLINNHLLKGGGGTTGI